jgi:hypothetical protein
MRAQRPAHARSCEPQQRQYLYEPTSKASKASKVFMMVSYECAQRPTHTHTHTHTHARSCRTPHARQQH